MSIRTKLVLVGCALLVAACGGNGTTAAPPTTTSATATSATSASTSTSATATTSGAPTVAIAACRTESLRVTLGQGQGATGHHYVPIVFTNTGPTCSITGFPGVSYYAGADHHQVGDAATRELGPTPTIVLRPGESAFAWLNQVNADMYDPSMCQPLTVTGLRVYPPDNTGPVLVPEPGARACARHMDGQLPLTVRTVQAGTSPN